VKENENPLLCRLRLIKSQFGMRLERNNQLHLRHAYVNFFDVVNCIHHSTCQGEVWLKEWVDGSTYEDVHTTKYVCN